MRPVLRRALILLAAVLGSGSCSMALEPDVEPVEGTCVIYQLPDGTIMDRCE